MLQNFISCEKEPLNPGANLSHLSVAYTLILITVQRFVFYLLLALLGPISLCAQEQEPFKVKYGRPAEGELDRMPVGRDSAAEAYVLYDSEDMRIRTGNEGRLVMDRIIHQRIKLIRESSFDRAEYEVYYRRGDESVSSLDALVHLPTGGVVKLKRSDFVTEDYDDDTRVVKWTFPQLTEGAVIEYRYIKTSEYITIPPRFFYQTDIPIYYTEYTTTIPGNMSYVNLGNATNHHVYESKVNTVGNVGEKEVITTQGYYNMPSYETQPYTNNFEDYVPHARLQLQTFRFRDGRVEQVFFDWPKTSKDMDDRVDFGRAYRGSGASNKVWKDAEMKIAGLTTETEKAKALYEFVAGNINWNGRYSFLSENVPDKVYAAKEGNSGEMSLMLLALLQRAGIEAQPVLVGLRNNGSAIEIYPIMTQFDHVMVVAQLDGEEVVLDPGSVYRPMGLPRYRALNHRGMVLEPGNPHWMDIKAPTATQTVVTTMAVDEMGTAEVDFQARLNSYYAISGRSTIRNSESDAEFPIVEDVMENYPDAEVGETDSDSEDVSGRLGLTLHMTVPVGEEIDDYMYVQPLVLKALNRELVDAERRYYPVDFGYPWKKRFISKVTVPEGFVVDEIPESIRFTSEDKSVSCTYVASEEADGIVNVSFTVAFDKVVYPADEYGVLKKMFEKIIEMQDATIVLKRAK